MIPVEAASRMPIRATVTAIPPRTRPNSLTKLFISWPAMPERSSIRPMKMNIGRATRTQFFMTSQIRSTTAEV